MSKEAVNDSLGNPLNAFDKCLVVADYVADTATPKEVTVGGYISFIDFWVTGVAGTFELYDKNGDSGGSFTLIAGGTLQVPLRNVYISKIKCTTQAGGANYAGFEAFGGN